jgi:hypothetical protein
MSIITRPIKFLSGLLSDKGLTKKAYLNALTVVFDYGASLLVGYIITPLMVRGLGDFLFGMWQVLVRLIGYITPASGRPGFALKATLANQQASTDYDQKRRYVGSTIIVWLIFLPLLVGVGGIVSWFSPYWVKAPTTYVWIVRAVAGILVFGTILDTLSSIPQVTLQGENLGYKRMGMSALLIIVGGGFTWLALYLKAGLLGIAAAHVASTIIIGLFYLGIVRNSFIWLSVTTLGASILIWNRVFLGLWVGADHYSGSIPNLLILVSAIQLTFIRSDGNIIDLTLRLSQKVLLGLLSVVISVGAASIMVGYFKLGIVGLCLGIMAGRLILNVGYPILIGRFLGVSFSSQITRMIRPIFVTILLFSMAAGLEKYISIAVGNGIKGWLIFIFLAGLTGILMLLISFYTGLSGNQRKDMIYRIGEGIKTAKSS